MSPTHRFPFTHTLKGAVAEAAIASLLRSAGALVYPAGLHEIMPQAADLDRTSYHALPEPLRRLPDFYIVPCDGTPFWLEAKFCTAFTRKRAAALHGKLSKQAAVYNELYAVIMRGTAPGVGQLRHEDYVRVVPPARLHLIESGRFAAAPCSGAEEAVWRSLPTITSAFDWVMPSSALGGDKLVPLLRSLGEI